MLTLLDTAEQAERARGREIDDSDRRWGALTRARALASLGRTEEALALLPGREEAERHADLRPAWTKTVELLVAAGAWENDAELGATVAGWVGYLDGTGSHRPCVDLLLAAGRLALARGARTVALTLAATGERKLTRLRRTDGVAAEVAALRAAAEALPVPELPVPPGELLAHLAAVGVPPRPAPTCSPSPWTGTGASRTAPPALLSTWPRCWAASATSGPPPTSSGSGWTPIRRASN